MAGGGYDPKRLEAVTPLTARSVSPPSACWARARPADRTPGPAFAGQRRVKMTRGASDTRTRSNLGRSRRGREDSAGAWAVDRAAGAPSPQTHSPLKGPRRRGKTFSVVRSSWEGNRPVMGRTETRGSLHGGVREGPAHSRTFDLKFCVGEQGARRGLGRVPAAEGAAEGADGSPLGCSRNRETEPGPQGGAAWARREDVGEEAEACSRRVLEATVRSLGFTRPMGRCWRVFRR